MQNILGIESSCDETGVAIYSASAGLVKDLVYTQADHAAYGGVVPELASRDHIRKLPAMLHELHELTGIAPHEIDAVAYTAGPGLAGALLVGAATGVAYAAALDVPAIAVHHMEAHLLSPLLEEPAPEFPFVALLVSGGHTMLVAVEDFARYQLLGETLDDAAGEAFDKTARLLDLGYPGGPEVARLAIDGNSEKYEFPRPMTRRPGLDFSFSGLETHTRELIARVDKSAYADVAAGFEQAVAETLAIKCRRALEHTRMERLVVAGGVSANLRLRAELDKRIPGRVYYPSMRLCTDNGAMIAHAGWYRRAEGSKSGLVRVRPRWPIDELNRQP